MKAKEYIEAESFVINNPDCPVISKGDALKAIEMAKKENKEKSIEAFRNFAHDYWFETGNFDICDNEDHYLKVFKEKLEE